MTRQRIRPMRLVQRWWSHLSCRSPRPFHFHPRSTAQVSPSRGGVSIFLAIALGVVLLLGLNSRWVSPAVAQSSQQVTFRISRLETENRMLQSRLSQLESQVTRLSRASGINLPPPEETPVPPDPTASPLASDPMFDRLATLVIETRQDVFALEERLDALEARVSP